MRDKRTPKDVCGEARAGAEKFAADLNFGEKKRHFFSDWSRTPTDGSDQPSLRSMKGVTVVTQ